MAATFLANKQLELSVEEQLEFLVMEKRQYEQAYVQQLDSYIEMLRYRGMSWQAIGQLMHISGEAVRKQFYTRKALSVMNGEKKR